MTAVTFDIVALDKASKTFEAISDNMAELTKKLDKLGKTKAEAQVDVETDKADGKLKAFGTKAVAGVAAVGLAAGAALTKGITDAMDTQAALKKLDAQLGASAFDSQKHGRVAGKLFAEAYGESMGEVADALKSVVQNIGGMRDATEDELKVISARAMDTAAVLGEEVAPVTRAVAQMLRTGMAQSAEEAFDILVFGAQRGANVAEDLLDTFSEYSTQFRDLGLDGKTALGILRQGLQGGARDADIVADALKEMNIRVQDKTAAKALKDLGLNADDMARAFSQGGPKALAAMDKIFDKLRALKDPTERYALAQQIVGTQSEDLADALLQIDPSSATQGMDELAGATQRAGDTMADTAQNKLTALWRSVKLNVVDFLGNEAIPRIEEFAAKLDFSQVVQSVRDMASRLKSLWDEVVADVRAWSESHQGEIRSMVDNARGLFEQFRETANTVIEAVRAFWEKHGEQITAVVVGSLTNITGVIKGALQIIQGIFQVFSAIVSGDWDKFWAGLRNITEGQLALTRNVVDGTLRLIVGAFGGSWDNIKRDANAKWGEIVATVRGWINKLLAAWNFVADKLGFPKVPLLDIGGGSGGGGGGAQRAMATGGPVPGTGNTDSVPALLMPGEYVLSKRAVQRMGGTGAVDAMHRGMAHFAEGGPVDSWIRGMFTGALGPLPGGGMAADVIRKLVDATLGKLLARVNNLFSGAAPAGAGVQRWAPLVLQALAMMGQPATLLQTVLRRMNQESGGNPRAINLWDINAMRGDPSRGLMQTIGATFNRYHYPGTSWDIYDPLANILASMRYALARYGSLATAYNRPGGYDSGGWLMPGLTLAYNGTGRPERVLPPGAGADTHIHLHGTTQQLLDQLQAHLEQLRRQGRLTGLTR